MPTDASLATITEKSYLNRLDELLAESRRLSEANCAKIRIKLKMELAQTDNVTRHFSDDNPINRSPR